MFEPVTYTSGHRIEWLNGDYRLKCPSHGDQGFRHMGQIAVLDRQNCPGCGAVIGDVESGQAFRLIT